VKREAEMITEIYKQIEQLVSPLLEANSFELVELKVDYHNRTFMIEILADRPQGGITIEECAFLNKMIVAGIEEGQLIRDPYELAVASPGLDRPLTTEKDFLRVKDQKVRILLAEPVQEKWEYVGRVVDVFPAAVTVTVKTDQIKIPLDKIKKAVQFIE
jgi:ribosome maturation factor RimP